MNKNDIKLIIVILVIVGILILIINLNKKEGDTVEVYYKDDLVLSADLSINNTYTVEGLLGNVVIEVNQDTLAKQGTVVAEKASVVVYAKPMEDGSMAIGLFNRSERHEKATVTWKELGIRGEQKIRDLWRQQDIATSNKDFTTDIAPHGVRLIKIYPGNSRLQATSGR